MKRQVFVAVMLLALSGCQLNTKVPDPISENTSIEPKISSVSVPIVVPSDQIREILQRTINENLVDGYLYKQGGIKIAPATDLQVILRPAGAVSVSASDNLIRLRIPLATDLYVSWKTCVNLFIGHVCTGHHEDAQAAFTVLVDMKPEITPDYGVNPKINLTYNLDKPVSFKIGPFTVNLVSYTNDAINKQLTSLQSKLNTELASKLKLRDAAEKAWAITSSPILVSESNNLWLAGRLLELYSAPLTTEDGKAIFNLGVAGKFSAVVGESPAASSSGPLPPLRPIAATPGFVLNMPLAMQFTELEKRVNALPEFSYDHKGNVITVKKVALSSTTDGRVSLGLQVNLATAGNWLDKSGWVYLTGTPVYDQATKRVVFKDLGYTAQTESVLANQAAWAVEPLVVAALKERAYIDISDYLSAAQVKANAFAASYPINGVGKVAAQLNELSIEEIVVQQKDIVVVASAKGSMTVTIDGFGSQ